MDSTVPITAVAHGGEGVARIGGQVCFVAYGLPGDVVQVQIARRAKGVLWARIETVLEPSPYRQEAPCPKFGQCGGCDWLHFAYPAQAEWKRRTVRDCLQRIAHLEVDPEWAEDAGLRLSYRTRAEFHSDGRSWGFYERGSHRIVDLDHCVLCHPRLNGALSRLRTVGLPQSVEIVVNPEGDDILLWTKGPHEELAVAFPHVNSPRHGVPRDQFLFDGTPVVCGTFSQSSLLLNRILVQTVRDLIGNARRVLDLYCGSGNLSIGLAEPAFVLGLDHNRASVEAAAAVGRGAYRVGNEAAFRQVIRSEPWDVVLLDPPRAGAKTIAQDLAEAKATAIVYVSCDPATLARDLRTLVQRGWGVIRVVVVDMFPHTSHIETVCRLERRH